MTDRTDNPAQGKPVGLEPIRRARSVFARWLRDGFWLRCCRTSPGSVTATNARTTPTGSRPDWQRTDLISPEREAELRTVFSKWEYLYWDMLRLHRCDVEWLLVNKRELRKAYLIAPYVGPLPLCAANLQKADLSGLPLEECDLRFALLDGADLDNTHLENANLEYASLAGASLAGADLRGAWLARANLREVWLDHKTVLTGAHLFTEKNPSPAREYVPGVRLAGVRWNDTDISSVGDIDQFRRLGDDLLPLSLRLRAKLRRKDSKLAERVRQWKEEIDLAGYQKYLSDAIAAYRQFATVLGNSGLPHIAVGAEYRARQLERQVRHPLMVRRSSQAIRRRYERAVETVERRKQRAQRQPVSRRLASAIWFALVYRLDLALRRGINSSRYYCTRAASFLLDLICGYGYKPVRVLITYVVTILVFARIYATYAPQPRSTRMEHNMVLNDRIPRSRDHQWRYQSRRWNSMGASA